MPDDAHVVSDIGLTVTLDRPVAVGDPAFGFGSPSPMRSGQERPPPGRPVPLHTLLASVVIHLSLLTPLVLIVSDEGIGGGGVKLDAISVELVVSDTLESLRPTAATSASAGAPNLEAATSPGSGDAVAAVAAAASGDAAETPKLYDPPFEMAAVSREVPLERVVPDEPAEIVVREVPRRPEKAEEIDATVNPSAAQQSVPPLAPPPAATSLSTSGNDANEGKAAASPGQIARYATEVRTVLGRARPKSANEKGKLIATFEIGSDGRVTYCNITKSSGSDALDRVTAQSIRALPFPPPPHLMTAAQRTFSVPFQFK